MKHKMKKLLAMGLSLSMLTSLAVPAMAAEEKITDVTNAKGRTIHFVDSGIGDLMNDEVEFYKKAIQSNYIFQDWVSLAYNIFESEDKTRFDDKNELGGNWDKNYGQGTYIDFMDYMLNKKAKTINDDWSKGGHGLYGYSSTGLTVATSLAEVQKRAANDIAALNDSLMYDFTSTDVLKRHDMNEALTDKKQVVLYSTVTDLYSAIAMGGSRPTGYDSFTIAFYDFQLHVLDDGKELDVERAHTSSTEENKLYVHTINNSLTDLPGQNITLDFTVNETLSTSLTNAESYTYGGSIGTSSYYDTKIDAGLGPWEPGLEVKLGFEVAKNHSYTEAVETAWTDSVLTSENTSKTNTVHCLVPAHTAFVGSQAVVTNKVTDTYDCPVGISFKVAIFSMCSNELDDDYRSFVTLLGGSENNDNAVENLYQRASVKEHYNDINYDKSFGYTRGTYEDGNTWCEGLNWKTIRELGAPSTNNKGIMGLKGNTDLIYAIDDTYPMSIAGGKTTIYQDAFQTEIGTAQPLYPIAKTYINFQVNNEMALNRTFEMTVGESVPICSYRVKAVDKDDVPYHGFAYSWGDWKIVDANGKETTSNVAKMEKDPVTGAEILTAVEPGTIYVKYFIPENTYYTYDGVASTNENIQSVAYKVVISEEDPEPFLGTIEVEGSVETTVGENLNLNGDTLTVTCCDPTGKEVDVQVSWESKELASKGINVKPDGSLTCTKPGTFHVRAYADDVYSNWVEVVAAEPVDLILGVSNHTFSDVHYTHWANDAVGFVYQSDIMNGVKTGQFNPTGKVTRGQVTQTLYNLAGQPFIVSENPFGDVNSNDWYANAVVWAAENGLTEGKSADRFAPNDPVTREQLVTFICRYADWAGLELPTHTVDLSQYQDAGQISDWAKDFIVRALEAGIINGKNANTLAPGGTATRAEIAQIFMNMLAE